MQNKCDRHIIGTSFGLNRYLFGDIKFFIEYLSNLPDIKDKETVRLCFVPTASNESLFDRAIVKAWMTIFKNKWQISTLLIENNRVNIPYSTLLDQDIVFVGGGDTAQMLKTWDTAIVYDANDIPYDFLGILHEMYNDGKIMCGASAGCICWFEQALSDSEIDDEPTPDNMHIIRCLGWLKNSCTPHFQDRQAGYESRVKRGTLSPGIGVTDGGLIHFVNEELSTVKQRREPVFINH